MADWARMVVRALIRLHFCWLIGICGTAWTGCRSNGDGRQGASETTAECELTEEDACELAEAFEEGFQQSMLEAERKERLHYQQSQQRLAGIESVSLPQFNAAWKIDLDVDRQPAREVLADLLSDLGLRLPEDAEFAEALKQPVRLKLRGGSRLQAIEEICSQIGVWPDYEAVGEGDAPGGFLGGMVRMMQVAAGPLGKPADSTPAVSATPAVGLRRGKRPFPIAFVGPYAIHINRLDEFPPYAFGKVEISVIGAGVPASVSAYWEHERWSGVSDFHVRDAHGIDLLVHDTCQLSWSWDTRCPRGLRRGTAQYELMNLLRTVRSIHLDFRVSATVPVIVDTVRLDDLTPGAVKQGKEIRVPVVQLQSLASSMGEEASVPPRNDWSVQFAVEGDEDIPVAIIALDEAGNALKSDFSVMDGCDFRLRSVSRTVSDRPAVRHGTYHLDGKPKSLVVKGFVALEQVEYPVKLAVDLRASAKQPVEPVELKFSGAAPLTIEVLSLSHDSPFRHAKLQMTNCSNKDIRYALCTLNYVDPAGRVVNHDLPPLTPPPVLESDVLPLLVPNNSIIEMEATAFDAPKEATSATAAVRTVYFADGTVWRPAKD